jgi:hypothetical protein
MFATVRLGGFLLNFAMPLVNDLLRLFCPPAHSTASSNAVVFVFCAAFENLLVNLFPPYLNILRRFNPKLYLAVLIAEHGDSDIVDDDGFVFLLVSMSIDFSFRGLWQLCQIGALPAIRERRQKL